MCLKALFLSAKTSIRYLRTPKRRSVNRKKFDSHHRSFSLLSCLRFQTICIISACDVCKTACFIGSRNQGEVLHRDDVCSKKEVVVNVLEENFTVCNRRRFAPRTSPYLRNCGLSDLDCTSRRLSTKRACRRLQTRNAHASAFFLTAKKHSSGCEDGDAHHRIFHEIESRGGRRESGWARSPDRAIEDRAGCTCRCDGAESARFTVWMMST
jgi:hypothetical protein